MQKPNRTVLRVTPTYSSLGKEFSADAMVNNIGLFTNSKIGIFA